MEHKKKKIPTCECCNSDTFITKRKGGGCRCELCKTIYEENGDVVGDRNLKIDKSLTPKKIKALMNRNK